MSFLLNVFLQYLCDTYISHLQGRGKLSRCAHTTRVINLSQPLVIQNYLYLMSSWWIGLENTTQTSQFWFPGLWVFHQTGYDPCPAVNHKPEKPITMFTNEKYKHKENIHYNGVQRYSYVVFSEFLWGWTKDIVCLFILNLGKILFFYRKMIVILPIHSNL